MLYTWLNFKIHVSDFDPASCRLESTMLFFRNNTTVLLFLHRVAGLPIWLVWSQILKFWIFLEIKKSQTKSCFFSVGKAWLRKNIVQAAYSSQISSEKSL